MINYTSKHNYALAVLSGHMSKAAAYRLHINSAVGNASAAAYRLEHTDTMRTLMAGVQEELDQTKELEDKRLKAVNVAIDTAVDVLSSPDTLTNKEKIAAVKILHSLCNSNSAFKEYINKMNDSDMAALETPIKDSKFDNAGLIG
ncbi:hypothetical protein FWF48_02105 [Candidatus Saccharibacteria bacterium]|nr:hypothetical protein [Candidatus Saccharibacteria bacterium]